MIIDCSISFLIEICLNPFDSIIGLTDRFFLWVKVLKLFFNWSITLSLFIFPDIEITKLSGV